jgi:putative selenate reductase molybdopterin-binding subunit
MAKKNYVEVNLLVNGEPKTWTVEPGEVLRDVLRREGYYSVKYGCEIGECGACTVLLDGKAVHSCQVLAVQAEGRSVTTLEGLSTQFSLHPLQEAFIEEGAVQCGYCTPGMVLAAKSLLDENPNPTDDEIKDALSSVLCRCTGYVKQEKAVKRVIAEKKGE